MNLLRTISTVLALLLAQAAVAGNYADAANTCFADNTSGKERKELARWIFLAIAAHPDLRELSSATREANDQSSRTVGKLVTRLVAESCAKEVQAVVKYENSESLRSTFQFLGKLAMQELLTNPDVNSAISGFEKYLDQAKINASLFPK